MWTSTIVPEMIFRHSTGLSMRRRIELVERSKLIQSNVTAPDFELFMNLTHHVWFVSWKVRRLTWALINVVHDPTDSFFSRPQRIIRHSLWLETLFDSSENSASTLIIAMLICRNWNFSKVFLATSELETSVKTKDFRCTSHHQTL